MSTEWRYKMIKSEYDVLTDEYKEIELTIKEIATREAKQKQIDEAKEIAAQAEADKAAAKASALAKLAALGLTEDEAKAIVG